MFQLKIRHLDLLSRWKIVGPAALLASLFVIAAASWLLWKRHESNDLALRQEVSRVSKAIDGLTSSLSKDLMMKLRRDMVQIRNGGRAFPELLADGSLSRPGHRPFDHLFIVRLKDNKAVNVSSNFDDASAYADISNSLGGYIAAMAGRENSPSPDFLAPDKPDAFVTTVSGHHYMAVISEVPLLPGHAATEQSSARIAIAGLKSLDDNHLGMIAHMAGTASLELVSAENMAAGAAFLPLAHNGFGTPAGLTWHPERPGDAFLIGWAPVLMLATFFIVLAIVFCTWRAMFNLKESEARASRLAAYDALSGVPNRLLFSQRMDSEISHALRTSTQFALIYLDLDRFKEINDTFGHDAGDRLIVAVTKRITGLLRSSDMLGRFGGDEFAILETDVMNPRDCEILSRRILNAISEPFDLGEQEVFVGVSIGIALFPVDGTERQELMRRADMALYRAKNEGRNRFAFFEQKMGEVLQMRKSVEDDLRLAISNNGLLLNYQPVMNSAGDRMVGVEALVRWPHRERGLIFPDTFISLAEDRGLILPLGEWVLRQACRDGNRWPGMRVAVNVSAIQFRHKDFVSSLQRILQEENFDPARLELELTESVVIVDADQAENAIFDLRAMGIRLALDDFGTGYSSLIYLRRFAFDKIKIDKSFLESMEATGESAIIVHSVVHLGRALGLTVTAEGVETPEHHALLRDMGCHEMQGYLFSRPIIASEIDKIMLAQIARTHGPDAVVNDASKPVSGEQGLRSVA